MNEELQAANTLLERGVRFNIRSPFWLRIFGKKTIALIIKHPFGGTLYFISKYYLEMGIDAEQWQSISYAEAFALVQKNTLLVSKIIAVTVLNSKWPIRLFTGIVARYLRWHLTPVVQYQLFSTMVNFSGVEVFTNTIRLAGQMRTTMPRNLRQEEEGS